MSKRCENVLETIGHTPLVRLGRVGAELQAPLYVKLEFMNPGGSVKDRIGVAMIEHAERQGILKPGSTIIEATSGNTGVGLAMVAAVKGYRCIFVMPDKMSIEKIRLLRAYGAEVVLTPASAASNSSEGYSGVAARLITEIPNSWQPNQFANLVNPQWHYQTTGPEIWEQTDGKITVFVAGVGTGGTISGVGKFLKEKNPKIKVVAADPEGSVLSGSEAQPWAVEGIGEDYVPQTLNAHVVDEWIRVSDKDSFNVARDMAQKEGLLVGGSTGTAVWAAMQYAKRLGPDNLIVAVSPDTGRNYLSKIYSEEWLIEKGFMRAATQTRTVREVLELRGPKEFLSVGPEDTAEVAIRFLREHDVSQLPVIENGKLVGGIREITVARLLHDQRDPHRVLVRDIMARPFPQVDMRTDVAEVYRLLMSGNSAVIVTRGDRIEGIVTRIDLVNFWEATRGAESEALVGVGGET